MRHLVRRDNNQYIGGKMKPLLSQFFDTLEEFDIWLSRLKPNQMAYVSKKGYLSVREMKKNDYYQIGKFPPKDMMRKEGMK